METISKVGVSPKNVLLPATGAPSSTSRRALPLQQAICSHGISPTTIASGDCLSTNIQLIGYYFKFQPDKSLFLLNPSSLATELELCLSYLTSLLNRGR